MRSSPCRMSCASGASRSDADSGAGGGLLLAEVREPLEALREAEVPLLHEGRGRRRPAPARGGRGGGEGLENRRLAKTVQTVIRLLKKAILNIQSVKHPKRSHPCVRKSRRLIPCGSPRVSSRESDRHEHVAKSVGDPCAIRKRVYRGRNNKLTSFCMELV